MAPQAVLFFPGIRGLVHGASYFHNLLWMFSGQVVISQHSADEFNEYRSFGWHFFSLLRIIFLNCL